MKAEELRLLISTGHEQNGIEFKPPFLLSDKEIVARIIRSAIAMANRRDGGLIIIGVEEKDKNLTPCGLSDLQLNSLNFDNLSTAINNYTDPNIEFDIEVIPFDETKIIILYIKEFAEIPVLCKKDFNTILRGGACYVRTKRKPESTEIPSQTEMRELLDLAKVKGIRKYITEAKAANIQIQGINEKTDNDLYSEQLAEVMTSKVLNKKGNLFEKISQRGNLYFKIFPKRFNRKRILDIFELEEILRKNQVTTGGWNFPHIDNNIPIHVDIDWIGQDPNWQHHLEIWKFFQSGQFYDMKAISYDWRDESSVWAKDEYWKPGSLLGVGEVIRTLYEYYEFASRLSMSLVDEEVFILEMVINNINGRKLYVDSSKRWDFDRQYISQIDRFPLYYELTKADLISNTQDLVIQSSIDLFNRFNWRCSREIILSWIEDMKKYW